MRKINNFVAYKSPPSGEPFDYKTHATPPLRLLLKHLDGFKQNQFPVYTLGSDKSYLTSGGEEFVESLEYASLTVGYPVVAEIAEHDGLGGCSNCRHINMKSLIEACLTSLLHDCLLKKWQ